MKPARPILTFHASARSTASPAAIYDALADLRTHLRWAGEEAPKKRFRLLSVDADAHRASVGDRFSSTGANMVGTFHDRSVVVEAAPDSRFGFDTDSTLERKHTNALLARFTHRYAIEPAAGGGCVVTYACEAFPLNYVPWWLRPGMRSMTRFSVQRLMAAHLRNLTAMAETASARPA
jgi:hypothetical protein